MPSGTFLPPGITTSNVKISTGGDDNQVLTAVDGETAQGEPNLTFDGSILTVKGAAVFNEDSADVDFRIESNGNANMFVVDAGDDAIGIGTASTTTGIALRINGRMFLDDTASNVFVLNSGGSDYGFIMQHSSDKWALGHGTSITSLGTPVLSWDDSGMVHLGNEQARDNGIIFDANGTIFHIGIDQTADDLVIGKGSTLGTTTAIAIDSVPNVTIGGAYLSSAVATLGINNTQTHSTANTVGQLIFQGTVTQSSTGRMGVIDIQTALTHDTGGTVPLAFGMRILAPTLTVSAGTVTDSASLYISNAMSNATNNYALWVDAGATRLDGNVQVATGSGAADPNAGFDDLWIDGADANTGITISAGGDNRFTAIQFGDTSASAANGFGWAHGTNGEKFYWNAAGQRAMELSGGNAALLRIGNSAAVDTRVWWSGNAQDYYIGLDDSSDSLMIQHGTTVGHSTNPYIALRPADGGASTQGHYLAEAHGGTFTSDGSSTVVIGASFGHDLVAANGDTSYHTIVQMGGWAGGSVTTQGNSETIPVISTLMLTEPTITVGSGDTVTASATLWINGEATEATSDYALLVDSGTSRFDGVCLHYDGVQLGYNGTNTGEDLLAYGDTSGYFMWWDASANSLLLGDSANGQMTSGITINQGAADDEILTFKSSDVAHGMTSNTETDTFAYFVKASGAEGGLGIQGITEVTTALALTGRGVTDNTTKGTGASPYVRIQASKKSGSSSAAVGSDANILGIFNHATCRFIFDAEGSAHADVEWTTYDTYDDLAVIEDMEGELLSREEEAQTSRRKMLEKTGIIGEGSWHMEDGKPRAMINMNKLSMLHHGALIQANDRIKQLETRLLALEGGK